MKKTPGQFCDAGQRGRRKSPGFYHHHGLCWWLVAMLPCLAAQKPTELFLNSEADCGSHPQGHTVDQTSVYNIRDVGPDSGAKVSLPKCVMEFRSPKSNGRLCVFRRKLKSKSSDSNLEFNLFDGSLDAKRSKKFLDLLDRRGTEGNLLFQESSKSASVELLRADLACPSLSTPSVCLELGKELRVVEWCTTSNNSLTIQMFNAEDLEIDMLVYDMSNSDRKGYLDKSPSCDSTFEMDNSRVTVTNMSPSTKMSQLHTTCKLYFEYSGQDNRTLCMTFRPSSTYNMHCEVNYTLEVYTFMKGSGRRELSRNGTCGKPLPKYWCSNSTKILLNLIRSDSEVKEDVMFHSVIRDQQGDLETLASLLPESEDTASTNLAIIIVIPIVSFFVLLMVAILAAFLWRRRQSNRSQEGSNGSKARDSTPTEETEKPQPPQNLYVRKDNGLFGI